MILIQDFIIPLLYIRILMKQMNKKLMNKKNRKILLIIIINFIKAIVTHKTKIQMNKIKKKIADNIKKYP